MLEAALSYARRGWRVLPLWWVDAGRCACGSNPCDDKPGKHPIGSIVHHGVKDATTDEAKIRSWWGQHPRANIGIACGAESDLLVIDADGVAGLETLAEWDREGVLPKSLTVLTGGGGAHVYLRHVPGLKNGVKFASGLDIRTSGGYVAAPPSSHVRGTPYRFQGAERVVAAAPAALIARLPHKSKPKPKPVPVRVPAPDGSTPYGMRAIEAELGAVQGAGEGTRNDTLNRAAFNLGQLHAGRQVTDCREDLIAAAMGAGLTEEEARKTCLSGWAAGEKVPRIPPPLTGNTNGNGKAVPPEPAKPRTEPEPADLGCTDLDNSYRIVRLFSDSMRYSPMHGWLLWDGRRWLADQMGEAMEYAKRAVESIGAEAARVMDAGDKARAQELAKWAIKSRAAQRIQAALLLAQSDRSITVRPDLLDADPWLLNVQNGTLDLRTGTLRKHRREDMITKIAGTTFDPKATCPIFTRFLERVQPEPKVREYLRQFSGYTLTGNAKEQVFMFFYGVGGNGKSTFTETIALALGEYATTAPFDTFLRRKAGAASNDLARLAGARMVLATEPDEGVRLSSSTVKQATGGEKITARRLYQEFFEYRPEFKLWLVGNHKPRIEDSGHGMWRRVRLIPWQVQIPEAERDKDFGVKLAGELPGVLAWAVAGLTAWNGLGLETPPEVTAATDEYRSEEDSIGAFVAEACVVGPEQRVLARDLRAAYLRWCEESGDDPKSQNVLGKYLTNNGFSRGKSNGKKCWLKIGITNAPAAGSLQGPQGSLGPLSTESPYTHARVGGFSQTGGLWDPRDPPEDPGYIREPGEEG